MKRILLILTLLLIGVTAWAQKPGQTPIKVSHEKQMMNGRKYYVHIVEKGQTVYSIARAYRVESFDAITHVDIHALHPGDTVWLPFRGQFTDDEMQTKPTTPAPVLAKTTTRVDTVYVRDTTYIKVPYAVHDTTIVTDTVTLTKYVTVHDTTVVTNTKTQTEYVPKYDTIVVTDTVTLTKYETVRDTTYIKVPYAVHDTTVVTDTVTLTKYVTVHDTTVVTNTMTQTEYVPKHDTTYITVHDTTYIKVPYAVHDTTVVTNTMTQTEYVPKHDTTYITVHDTTYIKVPYAVHDTTVVTNTKTQTEYVPKHDTTYITVHDTTYINVPYAVHDTTVVTNTMTQTEYVPKHDTTYITVHDTTYINVPYAVHDTIIVTNTMTQTEYVPKHDTTYITVRDTTIVTDTVRLTEYVTVHDTTYIKVPYAVHDTTVVTNTMTQTEYVPKHDTTYITVHDTTYIKVPYAVHDTTVVTNTMTQTEYVPKHDTTYITVHDTTYVKVPYAVHDTIIVTNTMTQTEYVPKHDTTYITVRDTTIVTDTVRLTEYVTVHDTTYVVDTVDYTSAPALAFASASAVALTENVPANQPVATPDNSATPEPQRREGKTLKVALMMPLHLNQIDEISTSKFDVEQRGKKSYKQFEFIEFYEGIRLAIDQLSQQGIAVEVNVVDVSDNTPAAVESAFLSHNVAKCDMLVALLFRDCFNRAAQLAQQAGIYIINPMATRSDICAENPYVVKIQPSLSGMVSLMLSNMKFERPDGHLYIIHSGSKEERAMMEELKRQLTERGDIKYTLFNWSQSARLATELKKTPACNVLSIYDQGKDNNHVYLQNLLNRLASIKKDSPTLYSFTDWTREYGDVDFVQLQQLGYHTFSLAWDMTNDVHVQFLREFRSQFGSEPTSQLAATGYDLMLYIGSGLQRRNKDFWTSPTLTMPTLIQPLHLSRSGAGLENDKAQLYRLDDLRFVKALFK